jgi:hypothetical protein
LRTASCDEKESFFFISAHDHRLIIVLVTRDLSMVLSGLRPNCLAKSVKRVLGWRPSSLAGIPATVVGNNLQFVAPVFGPDITYFGSVAKHAVN